MRYFFRYNRTFDWLFPKRRWRMPDDKIYLTFDDGPVPGITDEILLVLNKYNIKACFFCVGENVFKHPDLTKQLINEGHSLGNHTYNHLNEMNTKKYEYLRNVSKGDAIIRDTLGINNRVMFRPPYGRLSRGMEQVLSGVKVVMWSVLSGDFDFSLSKEKCLEKCIESTRGGDIVVFHDNIKMKDKVLWVLPRYIEDCLAKGYSFEQLQN